MADSRIFSRATMDVIRNLSRPHGSYSPCDHGETLARSDRDVFEDSARRYLGDASELSGRTMDAADWDEVYRHFRSEAGLTVPVEIPGLGTVDLESPSEMPEAAPEAAPRVTKYGFPFGRYKVDGKDMVHEDDGPVTYWFKKSGDVVRWDPYKTETGGWTTYVGDREIKHAVAQITADPLACAEAYTAESHRCAICYKQIYQPESVARGMGHICMQREEWLKIRREMGL